MLETRLQKTSKLGCVECYYFILDVVHLEGKRC